MGCPVGKEEFRIAAGANSRHGNMIFFYSCLQKNNVVCFPKIQLVLTILLFIKKLFPVLLFKSFLKFQNHIFAYFIAILTDRGTNCRKNLLRRACQLSCADDFIEKMPDKYNTYIEQGGTNVSGGQKQRLCIARALLKKPKVLILDDSTSAVDTATDARIRRAFAEEIPDTTKLIIAQRISSIQSADRIIVMDEGKISGFGTHEELMKTNAIYQEVYNSQIKGGGDFDENRGGEQA